MQVLKKKAPISNQLKHAQIEQGQQQFYNMNLSFETLYHIIYFFNFTIFCLKILKNIYKFKRYFIFTNYIPQKLNQNLKFDTDSIKSPQYDIMSSSSDYQQKQQGRQTDQKAAAAPIWPVQTNSKSEKRKKKRKARNLVKKQQHAFPEQKKQLKAQLQFQPSAPQQPVQESQFESKQIATENRMASFIQAQFRMKMHMKKFKTQKKRESPPSNYKKKS